jgi:hypothetical protein
MGVLSPTTSQKADKQRVFCNDHLYGKDGVSGSNPDSGPKQKGLNTYLKGLKPFSIIRLLIIVIAYLLFSFLLSFLLSFLIFNYMKYIEPTTFLLIECSLTHTKSSP